MSKKELALNPDLISRHLEDFEWLEDNINIVHEQIATMMADQHKTVGAIQHLLQVMPFVCTRPNLALWKPLLLQALVYAKELKDIDNKIQLWSYLGMCLFRSGNHKSAILAFKQALKEVDQFASPEVNLIARIGMLHGHSFFHAYDIDEFVAETINLAHTVNDESLLALLHFKLSVAYTHRARTALALGHAQTAYAYWTKLNYATERDRTLLIMGEACRVAGLYGLSKFYRNRSLSRYSSTFQSAVASYHDGALAYMNENYREAKKSLEQALQSFVDIHEFPYLKASMQHTLGLTYTRLHDYDKARWNLRKARAVWLDIDNIFEQANALYALGFLEAHQNKFTSAREYYEEALDRLATLPSSPMVEDLRQNIIESLGELPTQGPQSTD